MISLAPCSDHSHGLHLGGALRGFLFSHPPARKCPAIGSRRPGSASGSIAFAMHSLHDGSGARVPFDDLAPLPPGTPVLWTLVLPSGCGSRKRARGKCCVCPTPPSLSWAPCPFRLSLFSGSAIFSTMWLLPVSLCRWLLPSLRAASLPCLTVSAAMRRCCPPFAPLLPRRLLSCGQLGAGVAAGCASVCTQAALGMWCGLLPLATSKSLSCISSAPGPPLLRSLPGRPRSGV